MDLKVGQYINTSLVKVKVVCGGYLDIFLYSLKTLVAKTL